VWFVVLLALVVFVLFLPFFFFHFMYWKGEGREGSQVRENSSLFQQKEKRRRVTNGLEHS
jgi:hypothetical protein